LKFYIFKDTKHIYILLVFSIKYKKNSAHTEKKIEKEEYLSKVIFD